MANTHDRKPRHLPRTIAFVTAITLAVIALLYTLAGFVLLPWYAKRELPRLVDAQLHRHAQAGDITFNPFTLTLEIKDFALKEKDGRPMVAFKHAIVDIRWRSLTQRAVVFGAIRLDAPALHVEISPEGRLNLAALFGDQTAAPHEPKPSARPHMVIGDLQIDHGTITIDHQRVGYTTRIEQLAVKMSALSTFSGEKGPYVLSARTPGGAVIKWKGEAAISPLVATGTIAIENGALPEFQPFVKEYLNASITDGRVNVELPYRFTLPDGRPRLEVNNGKLSLDSFALAATGTDAPSIRLGALALDDLVLDLAAAADGKPRVEIKKGKLAVKAIEFTAPGADAPTMTLGALALDDLALDLAAVPDGQPRIGIKSGRLSAETFALTAAAAAAPSITLGALTLDAFTLDLAARAVTIGALRLDAPDIKARRDENGEIDLAKLLPRKQDAPSAPWQISVASVELAGGAVAFDDRASGLATALKDVAIKLSDVTGDPARALPFEFSAAIASGGTLSARGHAAPGGAVDAKVSGAAIALAPLQPLIARYANAKLISGEAAFSGNVKMANKDAALVYTGGAGISNVLLQDATGAPLLAWKSLATTTLRAQTAPMQLQIDILQWQEPAAKIAIAADQTTNVRRAFKRDDDVQAGPPAAAEPAAATQTTAAGRDTAGGNALQIRRVNIKDGAIDFSDNGIGGGFSAAIRELNGTLNGISSDRATRSQLALEGRVDEYGYARVTGSLNPFQPRDRSNVRVEFRNLEVARVTPYAVRFAGYKIASGRMSLDLDYRVRNNLIEGDNRIVLDQFTLGEKVESPGALDLPLELAIALLKDDDGKIDLALPISGNLDDPKFDYGAIVSKALGNLLTGIITAPFKLLARLFSGGDNDDFSKISFDPGSARLLPPEREQLSRIAQALIKRPELKLTVPGRYDAELDARALRRAALRRELAKRAGLEIEEEDPPGPLNIDDARTRTAVRELFAERLSSAELDKLRRDAEAKARAADGEKSQEAIDLMLKLGRFASGEPRVMDTSEFYRALGGRLLTAQPLAADALSELARKRAAAIGDALKAGGIAAARVTLTTASPLDNPEAKTVALELALSAR